MSGCRTPAGEQSGPRAYGYAPDRITVIGAEADVIRECARRILAGESLCSMCNDLNGRAILFRTDFSEHWGTPAYFADNPFLTAGAADLLVSKQPAFVGIDSLNIDDTGDPSRPAHTKLLAAGIPICEHMTNLKALPSSGARLHAVPIAWVGGGTFPVRAYALVDG